MKVSSIKTLGNMDVRCISDMYQSTNIRHYCGKERKIFYTSVETAFPTGEKIASVSDLEGNIVTANSTFAYMSGYTRRELVGMPHHVLRHPDMPKVAFENMWQSLNTAGEWKGYVKNLRKDGGFYWVYASVFSLTRNGKLVGYTSMRSEAPRDKIISYTELYSKLLKNEQRASGTINLNVAG